MMNSQFSGSSPQLNRNEYRADLAGLELTEEQETEILEILWSIMGFFARTGFEVDVCGLIFQEFNELSAAATQDGKLEHSSSKKTPSSGSGKERAT